MDLNTLLDALRELLAAAETDGRDLTEDEAERAADLTSQINAAKGRIEVRSAAAALLTPVSNGLAVASAQTPEVEKRFDAFLRSGGIAYGAEFRAQSEGVSTAGGYLVPSTMRDKMVERRLSFGGFQTVVETVSTSAGEPIEWPTLDDTANVGGIVAENAAYPGSDGADLVFGTKTLGAYKYGSGGASSLPLKVSLELLQDSAFDVRGKISNALGTRIARVQAPHWLTGTGVGQPEGLLTPKTALGNIASTTTPTYAELLNTVHTLDPEYRDGASWVMNDATLEVLRGMLDANNRPLLSDANNSIGGPLGGQTLMGYPVVIDQAMPSIAASGATKFLTFGRMQEAYVIRRVASFTLVVLNELYAASGQVGFLGFERADGCVQDANAYVVLASKA